MISREDLLKLAPQGRNNYLEGILNSEKFFNVFEINTKLRFSHFLAQIIHESNGLKSQIENLNYKADRLVVVWPSRFGYSTNKTHPNEYANNPEKLANFVYGNRMGNDLPGDGYKYRGRGLIQVTGKEMYKSVFNRIASLHLDCPNFVEFPDKVIDKEWCALVACAVWDLKGCNSYADNDDLLGVTKKINGGLIGLKQRQRLLFLVKEIIM